jgi:class 3 adenylate cyclase
LTEYLPDLHEVLLEDLRVTLPDRLEVRMGLHVGPVTAGVLGKERLQYDVWGDTVNVASRMESTGEPGRIHVSEQFASFLGLRPRNDSSSPIVSEELGTWHLALRGETELKGKGLMTTYWLESAR